MTTTDLHIGQTVYYARVLYPPGAAPTAEVVSCVVYAIDSDGVGLSQPPCLASWLGHESASVHLGPTRKIALHQLLTHQRAEHQRLQKELTQAAAAAWAVERMWMCEKVETSGDDSFHKDAP